MPFVQSWDYPNTHTRIYLHRHCDCNRRLWPCNLRPSARGTPAATITMGGIRSELSLLHYRWLSGMKSTGSVGKQSNRYECQLLRKANTVWRNPGMTTDDVCLMFTWALKIAPGFPIHVGKQATVLDARASRVKWPAQFMSHWYGILFTE